ALGIDVADDHVRAAFREQLRHASADRAHALQQDALAVEIVLAPDLLEHGAHALHAAPGGVGAGVAGAARLPRESRDPACLRAHDLEIGHADVHVLGGDVATTQVIHEATHGLEERARLLLRVAQDHRLAAAQARVG